MQTQFIPDGVLPATYNNFGLGYRTEIGPQSKIICKALNICDKRQLRCSIYINSHL
jgi:hypothetical protein